MKATRAVRITVNTHNSEEDARRPSSKPGGSGWYCSRQDMRVPASSDGRLAVNVSQSRLMSQPDALVTESVF